MKIFRPIRPRRMLAVAFALGAVLSAAACSSMNFGMHVPGTPFSVGTTVPLKKNPKDYTYVMLPIESTPPGASIYTNGELVGTTPMDVYVPFQKGFWGGPKESCQILLRKGGFQPAGARVFAVSGGISREPKGEAMAKLEMKMMKD